MASTSKRTATEVSAITAVSVGAGYIIDGEPLIGGVALAIGVGLAAVEQLGITNLVAAEDDVEAAATAVAEQVENATTTDDTEQ